jgi:hypothetical protein
LGGMIKHLAYYEDHWFSYRMHGNERPARWRDDYWADDPDWEWHSAAKDSPEELWNMWSEAVSFSQELLAETVAVGGLTGLHGAVWQTVARPACDGSWCT